MCCLILVGVGTVRNPSKKLVIGPLHTLVTPKSQTHDLTLNICTELQLTRLSILLTTNATIERFYAISIPRGLHAATNAG